MKILNQVQIQPNFSNLAKTEAQKAPIAVQKNGTSSNILPSVSANYFHPSFGSNATRIMEFSSLMDLISLHPEKLTDDITKRIETIFKAHILPNLNEKTYLDEGTCGVVHRINEKYVCKVMKPQYAHTDPVENIDPLITSSLKGWYGGEITHIGNTSILKNANPMNKAIPIGIPFKTPYKEMETIYKNGCIQRLAGMHQGAFDYIANEFKILNSFSAPNGKFYRFDPENPNNFLIINRKIKITDDLNITPFKNANNLASMTEAFLKRLHINKYATFDSELIQPRKEILSKCVLACERAELPLNFYEREKLILDDVLDICGIKVDQTGRYTRVNKFIDGLKNLRETQPDMNQRLSAMKNYIDEY